VSENERGPSPLIGGRYLLGEQFAAGGMGTVHLGRIVGASGFSRVVAIKRLFPGFATDASFRQMLLDEARFAARIRQPNVVPILDVVEAERDLYVVMEYVHGLPLAGALERTIGTPMPVEIAVAIAEAVLFGLHAAHEARNEDGTPLGIVHRDVSPQNVLVGADGVPRLIDFGIAKAATRIQVTDPGTLKGKAGYMAPEQLLHEAVARHADVFSASVVLWEMLANRPLFPFDVGERVRRAADPVVAPSQDRVGIDPSLDAIVLRGLAREPSRRFPTAEAMALELRRDRKVATAVEVAKWIARIAGDDLELSEERVRLFEQTPSLRSPEPSTGSPLVTSVPTRVSESSLGRAPAPRRRGWLLAVGAAVAVVGSLAAFKLAPRQSLGGPPLIPAVDSVAAALPAPAPPPPAPASPPAAPIASAAAPSASTPKSGTGRAAVHEAHERRGAKP
jgi:serine/threonine protein kinase